MTRGGKGWKAQGAGKPQLWLKIGRAGGAGEGVRVWFVCWGVHLFVFKYIDKRKESKYRHHICKWLQPSGNPTELRRVPNRHVALPSLKKLRDWATIQRLETYINEDQHRNKIITIMLLRVFFFQIFSSFLLSLLHTYIPQDSFPILFFVLKNNNKTLLSSVLWVKLHRTGEQKSFLSL